MSEKVMQYVGARYVPKFADPIEWQENTAYEALTVVMYNNSSYTSKIPVPANIGIPATNEKYWALTGNYNGQIEEYRQDTEEVKNKQSELDTKIVQEISDRSALIYNNNGKADIPLELSVEKKLSANDGAEISGELKYGTLETHDGLESVGLSDSSGNKYYLPTSKVLNTVHNRQMILIGDSYGAGWSPDGTENSWIDTLKTLNLADKYYSKATGGAGFGNGVFLDDLKNIEVDNPDLITDIVIGGGFNDTYQSGEAITNGINNLSEYAKETFKNADIWLASMGRCIPGFTTDHTSVTQAMLKDTHQRWMDSGLKAGMKILPTVISWADLSYFSSDRVHPNSNGGYEIGFLIAAGMTGEWFPVYDENKISIEAIDGEYSGNIVCKRSNYFYALKTAGYMIFTFNSAKNITASPNKSIPLFKFIAPMTIPTTYNEYIPISVIMHGSEYYNLNGFLELNIDGTVYLKLFNANSATYTSYSNITDLQLYIPSCTIVNPM